MKNRLSGNQIVVVVLAACLALVLAPVGVYAAAVQKVRLIDANSTRAVEVDGTGRLLTKVTGTVTANGTVSARPVAPAQPLHRSGAVSAATVSIVGPPIAQGKSIAIGSVHVMWTAAGGWSQVQVLRAEANGSCSPTGTLVQEVANIRLGSGQPHANVVFPVPQVVEATDRALCLAVASAIDGQVVVDGFLY